MDLQKSWDTHQYRLEGRKNWAKPEKQLKTQEYQYSLNKNVERFQEYRPNLKYCSDKINKKKEHKKLK